MRQVVGGVEGAGVCVGIHLIHDDGYVDSDEVTSDTVVKRLVVHVVLQSAGCIICNSTAKHYQLGQNCRLR